MRDERKFKEVIHTIKGAEKDKDKFFRAFRLSRYEQSRLSKKAIFAMFCMLLIK